MDNEHIIQTINNENLTNEELTELYWLLQKDQYKERPVTIQEFIKSDDFVHKKWPNIFPLWQQTLAELFPNPFIAPYNEVLISAAAGSGKCLGKGTLVKMYDNTVKRVEDVKVGDYLLGPDRTPRIVMSLAHGKELMYKVILSDGSNFICNKSHILSLKHRCTFNILNINIEDYLKDEDLHGEYLSYKMDGILYEFEIQKLDIDEYYGFTISPLKGNTLNFDEIEHCFVLGNDIVTHNTVTATVSMLYDIYKLGCLKNPCEFYRLAPGTMIIMAVFSATAATTKVNWEEITQGIEACPWITRKLVDKRGIERKIGPVTPVEVIPGIFVQTGSKFQHSMGKAIFSAMMDEASFGGANKNDSQKSYNELSSRIKTRFSKWGSKGNTPGQLFLISSPKEAGDFMQYRIEESQKAGASLTKIMKNIATWDADPEKDSDDKFTVFIGNENKEPCIYEPDEDIPIEEMDDLLYVPMRYHEEFKKDLLISIMNYGGIATTSDMALFKSPTAINEVIMLQNPFKSDVIELPFSKTDRLLSDYCNMDYFKNIRHPEHNRFIHIDAAFSTNTLDVYGLAASYAIFTDNSVYTGDKENISQDDFYTKKDRMYFVDFAVGITAPKGQEVPLYKIQDFIEWLGKIGYPIASISADTFQSKQTLQNLEVKGFETKNISVDRPPEGRDSYIFLKQLIYNKQLILPRNGRLTSELKRLRDDGKHVDHPVGCFTGDTVVKMSNGQNKTMKELADMGTEQEFWVYACKPDGTVVPAKAYNAHQTKTDKVVRVRFRDGLEVRCTYDHKFLLKDGTYKEIQYINNDTLMYGEIEYVCFIDEQEPVYDITVPKYHNFALANGVFVHNSTKDIADAVTGSIWNCAKSNNIINTAKVASQLFGNRITYTPEVSASAEMVEFERIKQNMSHILKGL